MHCCLRSTSETRRDLLSHNRKLAAPCRVDGRQISPSSLPWRSDPGAKNPTRRLADPRDHYYRTPIVPWGATVPPDRRLLSLYVSVVYVLCEYIQYIYVYVKRSARTFGVHPHHKTRSKLRRAFLTHAGPILLLTMADCARVRRLRGKDGERKGNIPFVM